MARPLRIEYPGALYHITSRGNKQQDIFLMDNDRTLFLEVLNKVIKKRNWICHAYCLMGNHYHLMIETSEANLSAGMRDLNGEFTQWFNQEHNCVGHILQGRFKAFLIEKESYFLAVARYIVLNPVRAGLVSDPGEWPWSSYLATAGLRSPQTFLSVAEILSNFGSNRAKAYKQYKSFVIDGIGGDSPLVDAQKGTIVGSLQFAQAIWEFTPNQEKIKEIPRVERIVGRPKLVDLFSNLKDRADRNNAIYFAINRCGYLASEIAEHLNISTSLVSMVLRGKR